MNSSIIELVNGDTVIIEPDRLNRPIFINDIYQYRFDDSYETTHKSPIDPNDPKGKYFPKENDLVWSFELGLYRVSAADRTTYTVTLSKWNYSDGDVRFDGDILYGVRPGMGENSWAAYLGTGVTPHTLALDDRYFVTGSEARYVIVFLGSNISANGEIVSAYYDNTNTYVNERFPLEVVAMERLENIAIKRPKMGYCRRALTDGETLTVVAYNEHNTPIRKDTFVVQLTNLVRRPDQGNKRVQGIEIISPYLSTTQPDLLEVPINATIATLGMRARVSYTDGSYRDLDVGDEDSDARFRILGLKYWSPAQVGPSQEVTLAYRLDLSTEYSYIQGETFNGQITAPYRIKSTPVDPSFSLKLFVYPTWRDPVSGWGLDYWLYNLDRDTATRVSSNAVELVSGSPAFNPMEYVSIQHLGFAVKLDMVEDRYGSHRHVQNVQVALLGDGGQNAKRWKVRTTANQGEWYGETLWAEIKAVNGGLYDIDISNGHVRFEEWLADVFYASNPLINPNSEVRAPAPTHMVLVHNNRAMEIPIDQWITKIRLPTDLRQGQNLYIKWIRRLANSDLQLGVSGLTVRMV